jgi:twitching motility protein PilT
MIDETAEKILVLGENKRRIRELDFVDLYLPLEGNSAARYNPRKQEVGKPPNRVLPEILNEDAAILREAILKIPKEDFSILHDNIRYRGCRQRLANGENWVCLRKISSTVPTLEESKIDPLLITQIRALGRRNGLVVICGGTGQGKSTTANAILADYLNRFGNVAVTIEDPVEFALAGERGNGGYCFQVEVESDTDWEASLKRALRWHPRYILVGEIRSPAAAAQVLRAATSGHLVICTMHAGSVEKGLHSMIQVAEAEIGSRASDLVAEGLAAVFHQTLTPSGPDISFLFTEATGGGDPVRQCIRTQKLHMLNSYVEQQLLQLQNNVKIGATRD